MARTVLLGKPDQKKIDTMKRTREALQAGIDVTKPGNTADDVAQAFWKVLDKYGIEKKSRTGYSIGIGYPPDWGEHTLNIQKGDKTILQKNVCEKKNDVSKYGIIMTKMNFPLHWSMIQTKTSLFFILPVEKVTLIQTIVGEYNPLLGATRMQMDSTITPVVWFQILPLVKI